MNSLKKNDSLEPVIDVAILVRRSFMRKMVVNCVKQELSAISIKIQMPYASEIRKCKNNHHRVICSQHNQ